MNEIFNLNLKNSYKLKKPRKILAFLIYNFKASLRCSLPFQLNGENALSVSLFWLTLQI